MRARRIAVLAGLAAAAAGLVLPGLEGSSGVLVWEALERAHQWGIGAGLVGAAAACFLPAGRLPGGLAAAGAAAAGVLLWLARSDVGGTPGIGYLVAAAGAAAAALAAVWDAATSPRKVAERRGTVSGSGEAARPGDAVVSIEGAVEREPGAAADDRGVVEVVIVRSAERDGASLERGHLDQ